MLLFVFMGVVGLVAGQGQTTDTRHETGALKIDAFVNDLVGSVDFGNPGTPAPPSPASPSGSLRSSGVLGTFNKQANSRDTSNLFRRPGAPPDGGLNHFGIRSNHPRNSHGLRTADNHGQSRGTNNDHHTGSRDNSPPNQSNRRLVNVDHLPLANHNGRTGGGISNRGNGSPGGFRGGALLPDGLFGPNPLTSHNLGNGGWVRVRPQENSGGFEARFSSGLRSDDLHSRASGSNHGLANSGTLSGVNNNPFGNPFNRPNRQFGVSFRGQNRFVFGPGRVSGGVVDVSSMRNSGNHRHTNSHGQAVGMRDGHGHSVPSSGTRPAGGDGHTKVHAPTNGHRIPAPADNNRKGHKTGATVLVSGKKGGQRDKEDNGGSNSQNKPVVAGHSIAAGLDLSGNNDRPLTTNGGATQNKNSADSVRGKAATEVHTRLEVGSYAAVADTKVITRTSSAQGSSRQTKPAVVSHFKSAPGRHPKALTSRKPTQKFGRKSKLSGLRTMSAEHGPESKKQETTGTRPHSTTKFVHRPHWNGAVLRYRYKTTPKRKGKASIDKPADAKNVTTSSKVGLMSYWYPMKLNSEKPSASKKVRGNHRGSIYGGAYPKNTELSKKVGSVQSGNRQPRLKNTSTKNQSGHREPAKLSSRRLSNDRRRPSGSSDSRKQTGGRRTTRNRSSGTRGRKVGKSRFAKKYSGYGASSRSKSALKANVRTAEVQGSVYGRKPPTTTECIT